MKGVIIAVAIDEIVTADCVIASAPAAGESATRDEATALRSKAGAKPVISSATVVKLLSLKTLTSLSQSY